MAAQVEQIALADDKTAGLVEPLARADHELGGISDRATCSPQVSNQMSLRPIRQWVKFELGLRQALMLMQCGLARIECAQ